MQRTPVLLLATLATLACASTGGAPSPAAGDRVLVIDSNGLPVRQAADVTTRVSISAPLDEVWPALLTAYAELGIGPTHEDRSQWRYGNAGFVMPARLRDRPSSDYFNCGTGAMGVTRSGRYTATVVSQLLPAPEGNTDVVTQVSARFRSHEGTSTSTVDCSSTGLLEQTLDRAIRLALARRMVRPPGAH